MSSGLNKWAPHTWVFFHCFANKINKRFFEGNRAQCLQILKNICMALPCVECTKHAIAFMNTVNERNVRTKEELIQMLFVFHNKVNKRINKKEVSVKTLAKYNHIRIDFALIKFINGYVSKYGHLMNGIISTLDKRKSIAKGVNAWMKANWHHFQ